MSKLFLFCLALVLSVSALAQKNPDPKKVELPADTLFLNGNFYTVNEEQPRAEAVAVKFGRIVFVGSNADAKKYEVKGVKVIDLKGRTVVPGMTDSHYHLSGVGFREMSFNLEGTNSLKDFLAKVKARVDKAKPGEWIVGRGWIEKYWTPQVFPTRKDLDAISPNNPVLLERADGHAAVANSMALKLAGVTRDTAPPFGGDILKGPDGEPNGMLVDNAQSLVGKLVPQPGAAEQIQALIVGARHSVEVGWTEIHDAGVSWETVENLKRLYEQEKVKLRVYSAIIGPGRDAQQLLKKGPEVGLYDHRLTIRSIKLVSDGALGSTGAALLDKYSDRDSSGFMTVRQDQVMPLLRDALKRGIQVETHAIGDKANRTMLDWYELAFEDVPSIERYDRGSPRWRIEHAQIVDAKDIPRFKKLGIIPSMQPSHAIGDLHFAGARLGLERLAGAYAWQSFIRQGSYIAGGSDAPVERGEPMIEFYAAVARKDEKGYSGEGWHPEQKVSREDALKMFTLWAALAAFEEGLRGTLEVGKLADMSVFSADIMTIPEKEILSTKCVMTVIGGEVVFGEVPKK